MKKITSTENAKKIVKNPWTLNLISIFAGLKHGSKNENNKLVQRCKKCFSR